jgi:hypothetical protein
MKLSEVKQNMHKSVLFDKSTYCLQACIMWLDEKNGEFKYSLNLLDKNKNSIITVPIEKVEVM